MKKIKILLFFSCLLMAINVQANLPNIKSVIDTAKTIGTKAINGVKAEAKIIDTGSLVRQIYFDTKSALQGLASALKVGTEHIYIILVRQQLILAISNLILDITLLILSLVCLNFTIRLYKNVYKLKEKDHGMEDYVNYTPGVVSIFTGIASLGFLLSFIIFFSSNYSAIITGFLNPEYGAIKEIINFVHPAQ